MFGHRFYHEPSCVVLTKECFKASASTCFMPDLSTINPPHFFFVYRITSVLRYQRTLLSYFFGLSCIFTTHIVVDNWFVLGQVFQRCFWKRFLRISAQQHSSEPSLPQLIKHKLKLCLFTACLG